MRATPTRAFDDHALKALERGQVHNASCFAKRTPPPPLPAGCPDQGAGLLSGSRLRCTVEEKSRLSCDAAHMMGFFCPTAASCMPCAAWRAAITPST